MPQTFLTHSTEETRELGKKLAQAIQPGTFLSLAGDLGAGKTTFVQGFLEEMGAGRPYVSPTFVIMKQYDLPETLPTFSGMRAGLPQPFASGIERIYHADAYRVEAKDFTALGFTEWCADEQGVVILEWPERVKNLIPDNATFITFTSKGENEREIKIEK
jgi:tRNA threonylcarbamoyladenosine biosynthesis protein TsaE